MFKKIGFKSIALYILLLFGSNLFGQVRSGSAFLKMLPGARLQSMSAAYTAVWDDPHAIYANPASAGFLREWQWSAGYTKWIADIYNASIVYGQNIRTPWSRHSKFALGLLYQGVPEFSNDVSEMQKASANDFVASLSMGQPLSFLSPNLSVGANLKYFKSTLVNFSASTMVYDLGILLRSPRFKMTKSLSSYLSIGAAFTQMGNDLTFNELGTPLPATNRIGLSFYTGSFNGLQFLLSSDYIDVKDEEGYIALGAELLINRFLSFNAGYDFGSDLFKKLTLGAGIRLDDAKISLGRTFPGRHKAFRLDFATLDEADFFSRTYRGTVTYNPTHPEYFRLLSPANGDSIFENRVNLSWQTTKDPDKYDDIYYQLIMDPDSSKLAYVLEAYDNSCELFNIAVTDSFLINEKVEKTEMFAENLNGGHYYWLVAAIDKDNQVRFAQSDKGKIGHFLIPLPDIEVVDIAFDYCRFITMDDYHGKIKVTIQNSGDRVAYRFKLGLQDDIVSLEKEMGELIGGVTFDNQNLLERTIEKIEPDEIQVIEFDWHTKKLGRHSITATVDIDSILQEISKENNTIEKEFLTIPKGQIVTGDSAVVEVNIEKQLEIPLVTEITFDVNSTMIRSEYLENENMEPILPTLAKRLVDNRGLKVQLKGFVDTNSGENKLTIADSRANAIKNSLLRLGVYSDQIELLPGEILKERRIPSNPQDAKWIFEERRYVQISAQQEAQAILFKPIKVKSIERIVKNVFFDAQIFSVVSLENAHLILKNDDVTDSLTIESLDSKNILGQVMWPLDESKVNLWLNKNARYSAKLRDQLGRSFVSYDKSVDLVDFTTLKESRLCVHLKFAKTDPLYNFYWEEIFSHVKDMLNDPNKRIKFEGHACATGPEAVNERLSKLRARRFNETFVQYVKSNHSEYFQQVVSRMDMAEGYGEDQPLSISRIDGQKILIGDNNSSIGRKLNRRIEMVVY